MYYKPKDYKPKYYKPKDYKLGPDSLALLVAPSLVPVNQLVLLLLVVTLFAPSVLGETPGYTTSVLHNASLDTSQWHNDSSIFRCTMSQHLPQYGALEFSQRAGERVHFRLKPYANAMAQGQGLLISMPAPWKSVGVRKTLATPEFSAGAVPVKLGEKLSRQLMSELYAGMSPRFSTASRFDPHQTIAVGLSPVRFASAHSDWLQCVAKLLPVNYSQIERSSVFWASGQATLSAQAKVLLDNIVAYSNADPDVYGFEVDGFTDTAGERIDNLTLSEQRAFLVTSYLISKGIDSERIATRAHGEREDYLIVKNERNAADRDRNRRVNIVVLKN